MYTDMVELRSLCKLIGPYGVKVINREILKFILSNVNSIKVFISFYYKNNFYFIIGSYFT